MNRINDSYLLSQQSIEEESIKEKRLNERFKLQNSLLYELFGSMLLMIGCLRPIHPVGTAVTIAVAIAFGFQQCGAHYNPSVTLNIYLRKHIDLKYFILYQIAQTLGIFLGGIIVGSLNGEFQANQPLYKQLNNYQIFLQEMFGTFMLILFVNIQTHQQSRITKDTAQFIIYFTCALTVARQFAEGSGSVLNAAMAIGAGLMFNDWDGLQYLWIYILAPYLGSFLSWCFFHYVFAPHLKMIKEIESDS